MNSLFVEDGSKLESIIDFSRLFKAIKTNWWKIALFSVFMTGLAIPPVLMMTPKYESYASILLKAELINSTTFEKTVDFDSTRGQYYETQYELLKSRRVVAKVAEELKLYEKPEFIGGIDINSDTLDKRKEKSIEYVFEHMSILPIRKTQLVTIGFEAKNAQDAADVANGIVKVFIDFSIEDNNQANSKVIGFLQQQVDDTHSKLKQKENDLNAFLKRENLINFYGVDGLQSKKLTLLSEDLATARAQRISLESLYNIVRKYQKGDLIDLMAIPDVSRHPNIENIRQMLTDQRTVLSDLEKRYGPKHERVIQARAQLAILEKQSNQLVKEIAEGIKDQYNAAVFKENQLQAAVDKNAQGFHLLGVKKTQYDNMMDDITHTRSLYNKLLQRLNETKVNNQFSESTTKSIDVAMVPENPTKPNKPLLIIVVAIMSLLIAVMLVVIVAALNNKIMTVRDIGKRLGLNVLGEFRLYKPETKDAPEMTVKDALENSVKYPALEAASLGMRSQLLLLKSEAQVIAVTSATQAEGKSLISSLMAQSMAIDFKVLLVDMNLRQPSLSQSFGTEDEKGLIDALYGDDSVQSLITTQPWFDFLPAGDVSRSPLVVLTNQKLAELYQDLRQDYDYIVVDTPAIADQKDTVLISQLVDAGILVVESNYNSANILLEGLEQLKDIQMLGGVLNKVDDKHLELNENLNLPTVEDIIL
ncbi:polysaccharide biosynthesis tyrosine autokinase [Vibrio sp. CK2-1]|uniref:GumC family protein n=1 Tax=Vibrio sp. CK2-1 TaxID=2912249 RepID=UPI001F372FDB|nr:polysaccharide biosynthesis tyrosine autokinase [Vibrio sp. CK2-1]MCF7353046.1 polysaccharide biosynthesis tyrosine autokinase [Vibrio sp. CK2-1]